MRKICGLLSRYSGIMSAVCPKGRTMESLIRSLSLKPFVRFVELSEIMGIQGFGSNAKKTPISLIRMRRPSSKIPQERINGT